MVVFPGDGYLEIIYMALVQFYINLFHIKNSEDTINIASTQNRAMRNYNIMSLVFSIFFRYAKKLPYVVTRDVCPSVVCGNIIGTRLHYN